MQYLFSIGHSLYPCIFNSPIIIPMHCLFFIGRSLHPHIFLYLRISFFPVLTLLILSMTRCIYQLHLPGSLLVKAIYYKWDSTKYFSNYQAIQYHECPCTLGSLLNKTSVSHGTLYLVLGFVGIHFDATSRCTSTKFSYSSFGVAFSVFSCSVSNLFLNSNTYLSLICLLLRRAQS